MNKSYNDIGEVLKDLKSDIEDVLMGDVLDEIRDIELSHVKNDVFSVYSPVVYKRRLTDGLDDPRNIVGKVKDLHLSVDNITEDIKLMLI